GRGWRPPWRGRPRCTPVRRAGSVRSPPWARLAAPPVAPRDHGVEPMPVIDLAFEITGEALPLDHGYGPFSALCPVVPRRPGARRVGVHPVSGRRAATGALGLTERSRLRLRLPSEDLAPYIALAGAEIDVDGSRLRVGLPRVEPLTPAAS